MTAKATFSPRFMRGVISLSMMAAGILGMAYCVVSKDHSQMPLFSSLVTYVAGYWMPNPDAGGK